MEQVKFKDVAHFFVGYKIALSKSRLSFELTDEENIYTIEWANTKQFKIKETGIVYDWIFNYKGKPIDFVVVRKLDSMTEEERKDIWKIIFNREFPKTGQSKYFPEKNLTSEPRWVLMSGVERVGIEINGDVWADSDLHKWKFNPHLVTVYLLSKHFDLFNLIENGEAIEQQSI